MNTDWMEQAKCQSRTDIPFFPEDGAPAVPAIRFCNGCPVKIECLQYALHHNLSDGVWGGASPNQRKAMRRRRFNP